MFWRKPLLWREPLLHRGYLMYREWPFQRRPLPSVLAWMIDSKSRSVEGIVKDITLITS